MSSEEVLSDSSSEIYKSSTIKRCRVISDDETESEHESDWYADSNNSNQIWFNPIGNQPNLKSFSGIPGINVTNNKVLECNSPIDFYSLFLNEEIIQMIVNQTNLYANQMMERNQSERLSKWIPTNIHEIKQLFGLIMWMGLVKLPTIQLYWTKDVLFAQSFPRTVMSRNRFEILLRMLHFADNEQISNPNNLLYKLQTLIDTLNKNFKEYYNPSETVCIDESIIPFRGRIIFRQYIKIFKLCSTSGYTNSFQVYAGKTTNTEETTPISVVMSLCQNIINLGHTLCTDKRYTSIALAEKLLSVDTHSIGILQVNRRDIPKDILSKKLQRGEIIAREHKNGITILKWKDKRNVLMLSTKHSTEMVTVNGRRNNCIKPKIIADYNISKSYVDLSDHMTSYLSPLRKGQKWYKRLAFELLFNTSVINAWIMHNNIINNRISILEFRQKLVKQLTEHLNNTDTSLPRMQLTIRRHHEIQSKNGSARQTRRRCKRCYEENVKKFGREFAKNRTKKVTTFCGNCTSNPYYCLPCFNTVHRDLPI
ncbi:piggyBac transposable element-derived protein 4-like [Vespa velutina]|uniref:piggyBac transposable element-derived protein 4-like n=1 Tax=Vespa velutina TaxID=202808 RepID=UPI001FB3533E|nr:piggyBac transposable element-derived protein 4-like [Vespa velutina]